MQRSGMNPEKERLHERSSRPFAFVRPLDPWEKWGPYVAERGWGTVREDYSPDGSAWNYFTHDHARYRAFRRCEDAIAGISDRFQVLLFAPVFWNGQDPILKERLFGVNSYEGNHGEDVKEYYYHLDATPTHSYLKYLYKYPHAAFPYDRLVEENQKRSSDDPEYELVDTGVFKENNYFDIFIEYAKADTEDLCIQITAINRGTQAAPLHLLAQLWFRNQWGWRETRGSQPEITLEKSEKGVLCVKADDTKMASPSLLNMDYHLGARYLYGPDPGSPLFTNNETNEELSSGKPSVSPYVRDAFHRYLIQKEKKAINPKQKGTKAALHYFYPEVLPKKQIVLSLRLTHKPMKNPLVDVRRVVEEKRKEADLFYESILSSKASEEEKAIQRQALAGMIWGKQIYIFDVGKWLQGENPKDPPPPSHKTIRNVHWRHIASLRIISMPDKWEYPWFAAWDLTFHTIVHALVDIEFAKHQLWMLFFDQFQHPNGAIPAYEWEFSDVNPPVQAWGALKLFEYEKKKFGREDYLFLERCFHKLLLNFAWWINKVDSLGNNVFEGGFLGMDNIGFTDRSEKLPSGFLLDQTDGAGWMSHLCLNLMRIALTLAKKNPIYESLGVKFFQHFIYITASMRKGYWRSYDMWNEKDGFFYSVLRYPDGRIEQTPVRSLVGVIPFFACDVWDEKELQSFPEFYSSYKWFLEKRADLADKCIQTIPHESTSMHLFGLLSATELKRFLGYIWDPKEFRSDYGLRSLSKYHEKNPAHLHNVTLTYEPGEAKERIKGGNSNWRGPVWFPLNYLLIDTLHRLSHAFKDTLKIQVGQEPAVTLSQMADAFGEKLLNLFKRDAKQQRPYLGDVDLFQNDPHFKDYFWFYEHFHGDTGRGLGASHQTGWTGLIAKIIDELRM
ncbi:MAG: glucosidase [Chlamydiia bacterium]|nr:glucosidase [Chlamydiia bacterium]